jgi:hypothetical protein
MISRQTGVVIQLTQLPKNNDGEVGLKRTAQIDTAEKKEIHFARNRPRNSRETRGT